MSFKSFIATNTNRAMNYNNPFVQMAFKDRLKGLAWNSLLGTHGNNWASGDMTLGQAAKQSIYNTTFGGSGVGSVVGAHYFSKYAKGAKYSIVKDDNKKRLEKSEFKKDDDPIVDIRKIDAKYVESINNLRDTVAELVTKTTSKFKEHDDRIFHLEKRVTEIDHLGRKIPVAINKLEFRVNRIDQQLALLPHLLKDPRVDQLEKEMEKLKKSQGNNGGSLVNALLGSLGITGIAAGLALTRLKTLLGVAAPAAVLGGSILKERQNVEDLKSKWSEYENEKDPARKKALKEELDKTYSPFIWRMLQKGYNSLPSFPKLSKDSPYYNLPMKKAGFGFGENKQAGADKDVDVAGDDIDLVAKGDISLEARNGFINMKAKEINLTADKIVIDAKDLIFKKNGLPMASKMNLGNIPNNQIGGGQTQGGGLRSPTDDFELGYTPRGRIGGGSPGSYSPPSITGPGGPGPSSRPSYSPSYVPGSQGPSSIPGSSPPSMFDPGGVIGPGFSPFINRPPDLGGPDGKPISPGAPGSFSTSGGFNQPGSKLSGNQPFTQTQVPGISVQETPSTGNYNDRLSQQRSHLFEHLDKNPATKELMIKAALAEGGIKGLQANMEQMANYGNARNMKNFHDVIHSGFFGPINKGIAQRHNITREEYAAAEKAFEEVRKGSNKIEYRTDQGTRGDPNYDLEKNNPYYRGKVIDGAFFADHPMFDKKIGSWSKNQFKADADYQGGQKGQDQFAIKQIPSSPTLMEQFKNPDPGNTKSWAETMARPGIITSDAINKMGLMNKSVASSEFIPPFESGRVTTQYGSNTGVHAGRGHNALDLAGAKPGQSILGQSVWATSDNQTVIHAGPRGGYGNAVITRDSQGRTHLYGHLDSVGVNVGDVLSQRQELGKAGSTGHSTGPHVHYEMKDKDGNHIDPTPHLFPDGSNTWNMAERDKQVQNPGIAEGQLNQINRNRDQNFQGQLFLPGQDTPFRVGSGGYPFAGGPGYSVPYGSYSLGRNASGNFEQHPSLGPSLHVGGSQGQQSFPDPAPGAGGGRGIRDGILIHGWQDMEKLKSQGCIAMSHADLAKFRVAYNNAVAKYGPMVLNVAPGPNGQAQLHMIPKSQMPPGRTFLNASEAAQVFAGKSLDVKPSNQFAGPGTPILPPSISELMTPGFKQSSSGIPGAPISFQDNATRIANDFIKSQQPDSSRTDADYSGAGNQSMPYKGWSYSPTRLQYQEQQRQKLEEGDAAAGLIPQTPYVNSKYSFSKTRRENEYWGREEKRNNENDADFDPRENELNKRYQKETGQTGYFAGDKGGAGSADFLLWKAKQGIPLTQAEQEKVASFNKMLMGVDMFAGGKSMAMGKDALALLQDNPKIDPKSLEPPPDNSTDTNPDNSEKQNNEEKKVDNEKKASENTEQLNRPTHNPEREASDKVSQDARGSPDGGAVNNEQFI